MWVPTRTCNFLMNYKILKLYLGECTNVQSKYLTQTHLFLPFDRCYMILTGHLYSINIFESYAYLNYSIFSCLKVQIRWKFFKFGKNFQNKMEYLHVWRKIFKKVNPMEFMEFVFCRSAQNFSTIGSRGFTMAQTDRQTDSLKKV